MISSTVNIIGDGISPNLLFFVGYLDITFAGFFKIMRI